MPSTKKPRATAKKSAVANVKSDVSAKPTSQGFASLPEAILACLTAKPQPTSEVITRALEAHPLSGKYARANAGHRISELVRAGKVIRPEKGQVALAKAAK
jgi:hypothetical protein